MNDEMLDIMKNNKGFIAALDQSGGSSAKTLKAYGIDETRYNTEEEMFNLIHEMRKRVITSPVFNSNHILGAILFERTMLSKIGDKYTAAYLWEDKHIVSFLKIDKGLEEEVDGVKLMKQIPNLSESLRQAKSYGIFGTKMRSVIYEYNEQGIKDIVDQQFKLAKIICKHGLVPIIEPEVDINSPDKDKCEKLLKDEVIEHIKTWDKTNKIMFKFTIPTLPNLYLDLYTYPCVVRIVALSGGYELDQACDLLSKNTNMIASFSRALLQNLNVNQTTEEFDKVLDEAINKIYNASID